jgi:ribosome modulation factor
MKPFKFFSSNKNNPTLWDPTESEIIRAIEIGRRAYIEGRSVDYNPFLRLELSGAFEEGWELEQDYAILRDAQQRANNEL